MSLQAPFHGNQLQGILAAIVVVCLSSACMKAESSQSTPLFSTTSPDLPVITRPFDAEPIVAQPPCSVPPVHAFWDARNRLLFAGVGMFRALDYASTRNMQARGREEILLPDEVANNDQGFAALEAAGTASSIALSYWMHRTGHHSVERWISIVHIGVTGFGVARNYALKSKHPMLVQSPAR